MSQSTVESKRVALPNADSEHRLRWDLHQLHVAMNDKRRDQAMTWVELADELGYSAARLTNLKGAKLADMALVMSVTQWLERPASEFIHPDRLATRR